MDNETVIRDVRIEDAARLAEIYSYYVEQTAVSFEYEAPDAKEFEKRITKTTAGYPYLVCVDNEKVVGYAYAGAYGTRAAYQWTAMVSIYVDKEYRRRRIGSLLYDALERKLADMGIVTVLAGVAYCEEEDEYLTKDSYRFHLRMGYEKAAHLKKVGKKFDRWYDLLWMQKDFRKDGN